MLRFHGLLCVVLSSAVFACSGGTEDDDGNTRDAGITGQRDAGEDRDGGEIRDSGEVRDAGERDAGRRDSGPVGPFQTRISNGDPANRIDIVFVGDGYTEDELASTYDSHVGDAVGRTFNRRAVMNDATQPFRRYREYFNVHQVNLASNESGVDTADGDVDTALDGTETPCGGLGGPACPVDFTKAAAAIDTGLAGTGIVPDIRVVLLNSDVFESGSYFPPEGPFIVLGGDFGDARFDPSERLMREIAVAWAGCAYENPGPLAAFPGMTAPGINTSTSAEGAWPLWMGYEEDGLNMAVRPLLNPIDVFAGGGGYMSGLYRPSMDSKLGTLMPGPFNAVAREAIVLRMFDELSMVDDHTDNTQLQIDPAVLSVDVITAGNVTVGWSIDGVAVPNFDQQIFGPLAFGISMGMHTITATVTDDTTFVRRDAARLTEHVVWDVRVTQ